jgi:predicted NBD/HSP70 family sugar kinase
VPGKGSNSVQMRRYNERVALNAIRQLKSASKADVARYSSLTPAAMAVIMDSLEDAGFIAQFGKLFGRRGQPSTLYRLVADRAYSIGIKIGRKSLEAVLMDFAGAVLATRSEDYAFPEPVNVRRIGDSAIAGFQEELGALNRVRIVGLGIASPYFLSGWADELGFPPGVAAEWEKVDLSSFFTLENAPVYVENDASAAALAEFVYGAGARFQDFMHVSIDTCIGGGLIQNGKLQTGKRGNTAAIAQFPVSKSMLSSVKPVHGPFEIAMRRASTYVLLDHLRSQGVEMPSFGDLEHLRQNAALALDEWQTDCADALAQTIAGIAAVVDVEAVIIDTILPNAVLREIVKRVDLRFREILPAGLLAPEILEGSLGKKGCPIGAAILPLHHLFGPDSGILIKKDMVARPARVGVKQFEQ